MGEVGEGMDAVDFMYDVGGREGRGKHLGWLPQYVHH